MLTVPRHYARTWSGSNGLRQVRQRIARLREVAWRYLGYRVPLIEEYEAGVPALDPYPRDPEPGEYRAELILLDGLDGETRYQLCDLCLEEGDREVWAVGRIRRGTRPALYLLYLPAESVHPLFRPSWILDLTHAPSMHEAVLLNSHP